MISKSRSQILIMWYELLKGLEQLQESAGDGDDPAKAITGVFVSQGHCYEI